MTATAVTVTAWPVMAGAAQHAFAAAARTAPASTLTSQHVIAFGAGTIVHGIGDSLRESFFMFWDTLWALIGGFALSGAVQAFAPRDRLRAKLGNHGPAAVTRASVYGALSSSCSYAASAMAKSLFAKGADFVTSMIFMFASTNLVVELGIVLVVLMGWQFAAAEYVGGVIMIVLLALLGGAFFGGRRIAAARANLAAGADRPVAQAAHHDHNAAHDHGMPPDHGTPPDLATPPDHGTPHDHRTPDDHGMPDDHGTRHNEGRHPASDARAGHDHGWPGDQPARMRTLAGWADAAGYTIADLTMLRREMVIGFLGAGFLAALVPTAFWHAFFVQGHGIWTDLENAIAGPFIALISFVCSIGNVPLAAALWHGGISFGGVVSFIFADLIALPLVLIYRKFYGGAVAMRMLVVFWAVMAAAGLATQLIFAGAGLIPASRPAQIVPDRLELNYTTVLNILFLLVFAVLYVLYRNRRRLGGGIAYAIDPVCGMQVEKAHAPVAAQTSARTYWFCSDHCKERFEQDPARFAGSRS